MPGVSRSADSVDSDCAVCGVYGTKQCSACKAVKYCSEKCQRKHWNSGHKEYCKITSQEKIASDLGYSSSSTGIALVPDGVFPEILEQTRKILFPYNEFVDLFNWRNRCESPPCGLFNSGNNCYANVALQCLTHTQPLLAYLMEKGHKKECGKYEWCFFCDFQTHVERAMASRYPLSPDSIILKLPNIGGNKSKGKQEDAHEFIRLLTDTMQSLCLDEFGGEEAIDLSSQDTTIIHHIFGGCLQSQVICTNCNKLSTRYENMVDLTVEIHGNPSSLEECLEQHTQKECLYGDNMYKCDGCNDFVKAWKRLCIRQAPNILSIAFKRFQTGSFGKLNKRITFPEMLDLGPYMTKPEKGIDIYKLYAVVVHLDIQNATSFGHYICYIKGFGGYWYRIDDHEVVGVNLDTVLSQGAYMLFYRRVNARPSCLEPIEALQKDEHQIVDTTEVVVSLKKQELRDGAIENSHGVISQGYAADGDYEVPVSHLDKLGLGTRSEYARDDYMADAGWLNAFYPKENLISSNEYVNSWINGPFLAEPSSSALEDYYTDRINTTPFPGKDLFQNSSRTSSLNDFIVSSSDESEEIIQEESLQGPTCPQEKIPDKFTLYDPTWKPVFSLGLVKEGGIGRGSKKRSFESSGLSLDDAANENRSGSPKRKLDDEEVQSVATTLDIDDFSSSDAPQLVHDVTEKEEMDTSDLDKSLKTE